MYKVQVVKAGACRLLAAGESLLGDDETIEGRRSVGRYTSHERTNGIRPAIPSPPTGELAASG
jgi:hypothetical protein